MVLSFNRWSAEGIKVTDPGLKDYISLATSVVASTGGRNAKLRFHRSKTFIVERLVGKLMVPGHKGKKHNRSSGHNTGKKVHTLKLVESAFTIIEQRTKKNPLEVFVKAIENAAPREEIISIEYGGARYPKAVECAPQRRVDVALRFFVQGTYTRCFDKKVSAEHALADEILSAFQSNANSLAIARKLEIERQADSSR
ncbi:30S ribosomal protein S7 [Candidatus Woesearchaeota archaeon]|nr:30S ribosomal protein S7 [Candidatus Woesearchaeota archaeon]